MSPNMAKTCLCTPFKHKNADLITGNVGSNTTSDANRWPKWCLRRAKEGQNGCFGVIAGLLGP